MAGNDQQGRWTKLFGRPTLFSEDVKRAKEVASTVQLFGIGDLQNHQYVKIIFEGIEGWERPLWASDAEWLYLRPAPRRLEDTAAQGAHGPHRRDWSEPPRKSKGYGGIQIGHDFANNTAWHLHMQKMEPEGMDDYYGLVKDGYEEGPIIEEWIEDVGQRVIVDAGDVFAEAPASCRYLGGEVLAEESNGRKVRFAIGGLDIDKIARDGNLWLRFGHGPTSWMDPFDCQVTCFS